MAAAADPVVAALERAATVGLVEDAGRPAVAVGLADGARFVAAARLERLTGLVNVAVERDAVVVDADTRSALAESWHEQLGLAVRLEQVVLSAHCLFEAHRIRWRLTKGAAVAHLDYPDPAHRLFGDVDVMVHPDDWHVAVDSLITGGYGRQSLPLRGDYDRRFGKGATFVSSDGFELDVHLRFAVGRFGISGRPEELFSSSAKLQLGGVAIPALSAEDRLLHACYHAVLGGFPGLRALRDVAQIAQTSGADIDAVWRRAAAWRGEAIVASAILRTWDGLRLDTAHPAYQRSRTVPISNADRRALRVFATAGSFRREVLTGFSRVPWRDRARFVWSVSGRERTE